MPLSDLFTQQNNNADPNTGLSALFNQNNPPPEGQDGQAPALAPVTPEPELPFMAEDLDAHGLPYYGEGWKGFARKTFAKIFDPSKLLNKPTEQQAQLMEAGNEAGEEMLNKAGWDEWLEKFTGIKGEDVVQAATAANLAVRGTDEEGNVNEGMQLGEGVKTVAGTLYRGVGQTIATGLEVLGTLDKVSRKVQAFNVAVDEIGDSASVLPDITRTDEVLKSILGDTPTAQRLGNILNAVADITPGVMVYNLIRAGTAGQSMFQKTKAIKDNLRASNMLYTMYWDESKKQEYFRRVQAGENPDLVMREIEMPWVELAGSIIGDPASYLGMGVIGKFGKAKTPIRIFGKQLGSLPWETVGRVPGFSEILGLKNIGRAGLASKANNWAEVADTNTAKAFQALGKVEDEREVLPALTKAINAASDMVKKERDNYGFFAYEAGAKAEVMKKTAGTMFQAMRGAMRTEDDVVEMYKAFRNITSENSQVKLRAFSHLKEKLGVLPFSTNGMQSMEFMTRVVDDVDMIALARKHGDNVAGFTDEAFTALQKTIDDFYPSVNDMAKAAGEIKTLGAQATPRQVQLAEQYKKLDWKVKRANQVLNTITSNKAYQGLQGFFANTMLGLAPRYAIRNLISNSVVIWHDLGMRAGLSSAATGAEVLGKSIAQRVTNKVTGAGVDWVTPVLDRELAKVKDILGFVPTQAVKGVGSAGKEGFGFISVSSDVEKVQSALITRYVVEREAEKFLRAGGVPDVEALGLPKEMAENLLGHTLETFGNVAETMKRFRKDQATGFYDTWRHIELNPELKDTLRRSTLLDELLDIRATAPDSASFLDQMDAFIKKIDDLAAKTADEPALVAADNEMGDVALVLDTVADETKKIFGEGEMNQFRALTQLRSDLRREYLGYFDAMKNRLVSMLPPEQTRAFQEQLDNLRVVLDKGNDKWRNYADEVYKGVYAQSKKGTPPAQLWNQVQTVMPDVVNGQPALRKITLAQAYPNVDPTTLTQSEFQGMLWKWFKEKQSAFWRGYTQEYITGQDKILEGMAQAAGTTIDDLKKLEFTNPNNPRLQSITQITKQLDEWESYLDYSSFAKATPTPTQANQAVSTAEDAAQVVQATTPSTLSQMELSGVENWKGGKSHLFNAVNKERRAKGFAAYSTIDEVPFDEAAQVLKSRTKPIPPYVEGTTPTVARQLQINMQGGMREALEDFKTRTLQAWGDTAPMETKLDDAQEAALAKWAAETQRRTVSRNAAVATMADESRNFMLHDYNKTHGDKFAGLFTMFHYWPSRTYARWMERVIDTPGVPAAYAKMRSTMERVNSEQPDFYRYNVQVPKLPGLNNDPMFFNLEAVLNPMYSLTGADFNDPKRRVDWLSSAVDDMGKFGFNLAMPLQWAMAMRLYNKNEEEAARRWLGRMVPVSNDLKNGLNLLKDKTGIDLMPDLGGFLPGAQYGEFDPFINAQGGFDPYEEKRIGRALAGMIEEGVITQEQAYDIMYQREGPEFDEAVQRAILERAPGQLASFLGGVGFKGRTEGDMMVEEFYGKYYKLLSMRENISPDEYRQQFDKLRDEYQFADTVLLAARGGDERDSVYAYNVLSRLPPGDSSDMLRGMGLSDELIQKFYNDKGDFSDWTEQDRDRFMGAMIDLGATFAMPDGAVREEWNDVKSAYKSVQEEISNALGLPYSGNERGVWDMVNTYYDLKDTNPEAAQYFKETHPEVDGAMAMMSEAKLADPLLAKYYASLDTVEMYYTGKIRAQLFEEFGKDIMVKQTEYYQLAYEGKAAQKAYLAQHPELKSYWSKKNELEKGMDAKILEIAGTLPTEADGAQLREGFDPANATQAQLAELAQGSENVSWADISQEMTPGLQHSLQNYLQGGQLTPPAERELEYLANKLDYFNADDLLRAALFALQRDQQTETQFAEPQGGTGSLSQLFTGSP